MKHPWQDLTNKGVRVQNSNTASSGVTGRGAGGRVPTPRLLTGTFLLTYREKRGKVKYGKRSKRKESINRESGKLEMEVGKVKKKKSRFKTTEISFGSTKMGVFYRKKAFHARKKSQEK